MNNSSWCIASVRSAKEHDRESSENRYLINNEKKEKIKLPSSSLL